ncbi:hypothetical protein RRG08_028208 [Elysia crispata]|uniref:Uncharacterized protein n=1 Tax=Elysia crispata TaxID=231223 RepID=A0AAE0YBS1_9GAST|nr:hypothetical protein RRG08_028208 [Elysia crispata]
MTNRIYILDNSITSSLGGQGRGFTNLTVVPPDAGDEEESVLCHSQLSSLITILDNPLRVLESKHAYIKP